MRWINANYPTSSLLANSTENNLVKKPALNAIGTNTAIRHNSFIEDNFIKADFIKSFDSAQIGVTEIDIFETSLTESGISKNGFGKIDVFEANLPKNSVGKVNPFHKTVFETALEHTNSTEIGKAQVNLAEMPPIELFITKPSFPVNSTFDTSISQTPKTSPSEIFFSPSVKSNQFFFIHDSTPEINNAFNNINESSNTIATNTAIGHDSFIKDNILTMFHRYVGNGIDDAMWGALDKIIFEGRIGGE